MAGDLARTPWQKVQAKFGCSGTELARLIGRHRSKVSRALSSEAGLISGKDQKLLIAAAKRHGVALTPDDLVPDF